GRGNKIRFTSLVGEEGSFAEINPSHGWIRVERAWKVGLSREFSWQWEHRKSSVKASARVTRQWVKRTGVPTS
ncbi:hypothetical protein HAX54_049916, partial [Datura stramonium]|nr:hypothetical protein [Datura stramonium]